MELDELSKSAGEWLRGSGPESDIVMSSRIRLARNLAASFRVKIWGKGVTVFEEGIRDVSVQSTCERLGNPFSPLRSENGGPTLRVFCFPFFP